MTFQAVKIAAQTGCPPLSFAILAKKIKSLRTPLFNYRLKNI